MCVVNKFEKVSYSQYCKDVEGNFSVQQEYENIKLPKRATKYSAGYDFFSPLYFKLKPNESIKIPTGIKCRIKEGCFLAIVPRSSLGFKYRLQLDNTVGIIDADYYDNKNNQGHIFIKITNDSKNDDILTINIGDAIAQGIFMVFDTTIDDNTDTERIGGIGSSDKK